jgi:hypothetical protein
MGVSWVFSWLVYITHPHQEMARDLGLALGLHEDPVKKRIIPLEKQNPCLLDYLTWQLIFNIDTSHTA